MKLAAIYNVFDGEELLEGSMNCLTGLVDLYVLVSQEISNAGERYPPGDRLCHRLAKSGYVQQHTFVPDLAHGRAANETAKRQVGIDMARQAGCTHFLHLDCDEYYDPKEFAAAKAAVESGDYDGSVCRLWSYFRAPHLRVTEPEDYWVPFIHRLLPSTLCGGNRKYPYRVDPTRNIKPANRILEFKQSELMMHHLSWVRYNIFRKFRNSTGNLTQPVWLETLAAYGSAVAGSRVPGWDRILEKVEVPEFFGNIYDQLNEEAWEGIDANELRKY